MKELDPIRTMDAALKANSLQGIPKQIRQRYCRMLAARAVRFYIENELDATVVDEDLADGKSDAGFFESGWPLRKTDLCNLIYSEDHERKFLRSLKS